MQCDWYMGSPSVMASKSLKLIRVMVRVMLRVMIRAMVKVRVKIVNSQLFRWHLVICHLVKIQLVRRQLVSQSVEKIPTDYNPVLII